MIRPGYRNSLLTDIDSRICTSRGYDISQLQRTAAAAHRELGVLTFSDSTKKPQGINEHIYSRQQQKAAMAIVERIKSNVQAHFRVTLALPYCIVLSLADYDD
ncbi:hypothetical protein QAD02_008874 [Eretmocerus hayati]|uniref:Uncharacterized protein n=1 Tax=Eretmocerus hayati TaxID=131215 RepID=A0ACC2NA40_9HYME|nr:hypothetical protein QAD02_008874 [Eretmocerus hayati]